jgi:hypothetical protein
MSRRKWCGQRRCALVVIDGGSAGAPGTRRDVDEVRLVTVSPRVWATWPIVSRRAGGERPEEARHRRASGACLGRGPAEETRPAVGQRERMRERKRGKQERECGDSPLCRYDGFQWQKSKTPASNPEAAWWRFCGISEGKERGGRGLLIGAGAGKKRPGIRV